jgi:2-oxopent-4-enoate/cis-2-oxohex-4-enoate hydratase
MAMDKKIITDLGDELYNALKNRQMIDPLSSRYPDMTVEDAYKVQERMIARRIEGGERIVGKKIGVTSKVVMNMLGVYRPDLNLIA